ncbi:MAG: hypothetical protein HY021_01120, partial [Burkholderiales bacterium]|nr:hypothetical protein [Burkholderiales bacterium]
ADIAASGRRVVPLVLSVAITEPAQVAALVLEAAAQKGCSQLVETTLFADAEAATLIARLRVYPLIDEPASGQRRIAASSYTGSREHELTQNVLDRLRPAALGKALVAEWLQAQASLPPPPLR